MSSPLLVIGNKRYSSWSLRPWLLLRVDGVEFREQRVSLYQGAYKPEILQLSPAGKVPVLIHGDVTVWDSLAICEYAAESLGISRGWPRDVKARAHARSICAEMHAGFSALRTRCTMNVARTPAPVELDPATVADVARIRDLWSDCLARYGGPFLFGDFTIADAFYAPVAVRFDRYRLFASGAAPDAEAAERPRDAAARAWVDRVLALPAMREWIAAGVAETDLLPQFEK